MSGLTGYIGMTLATQGNVRTAAAAKENSMAKALKVAFRTGGVAGMFLALPVIAILKIVFDRIEPLKPWGLLLGDEEGPRGRLIGRPRKTLAANRASGTSAA